MKAKNFCIAIIYLTVLIFFALSTTVGQNRSNVNLPDLPGYKTLKADLHMHSIYSDGRVWPDMRVLEAWHDGLDVIAITDHIDYRGPILEKVVKFEDENLSYKDAQVIAERLGISLIKGIEVNASKASIDGSHFNALFIEDANKLKVVNQDYIQLFRKAKEQGAFIQWNHPLSGQTKNPQWMEFSEKLYQQGLLDGIEIFNKQLQFPFNKWAKEKKLTITGSSDSHYLIGLTYEEVHRPMTLIFAKENTLASIKEAIFAHRTAVYFADTIMGYEEHLQQLFATAVQVENLPNVVFRKKRYVALKNTTNICFELELVGGSKGTKMPESLKLPPNKSTLIEMSVYDNSAIDNKEIKVKCRVNNFKTLSGEAIIVDLLFNKDKQKIVERNPLTITNLKIN